VSKESDGLAAERMSPPATIADMRRCG